MTNREKLLLVVDRLTALAFWIFLIACGYGLIFWTINVMRNPEILIQTRIAIGSGIAIIFGLFFIFLLDEEVF